MEYISTALQQLTSDQKRRLLPFAVSFVFYFVSFRPFLDYPEETVTSAFFKVLPIWSLVFYILSTSESFFDNLKSKSFVDMIPEDHQSRWFLIGLILSSLGDVCLVARQVLFVPGLLFFAIAQCCYLVGIELEGKDSQTISLYVLGGIDTFLCVQTGIGSIVMKGLVFLYVVLIFTMGWRAAARYEETGSMSALVGCAGALLFMFSDFIIAVDRWNIPVPMAPFIVMTTYYGAQLLLTLSTTKDLGEKKD